MIRLLHLIGTSEVGGTETFLIRLLARMDRGTFASRVCVLGREGPLAGRYAAAAERVDHLGWRALGVPAAIRWRRQLFDWSPDVVVLYGSRANLLGRLVRGRGRPAVVTALRSVFVDDRGRPSAAWLDRLTFGRVTVCVSNSRAAIDRLLARGYPAARLVHVPNAVEISDYASLDRQAARKRFAVTDSVPVVLNVANLKPVKGQDVLLAACAQLRARGIRHRLWLVGEGQERARLEALGRRLGLTETVEFIGLEEDVRPRYAAADVFVLSSRWEGMPAAVLEAMASGLPIVATRVGELADVVEDGVSGRLAPPGDAAALAAALAEFLADPTRREECGRRAAQTARRFSFDRVARRYEAIFEWAARRGGTEELPFLAELEASGSRTRGPG